MLFGDHIGFLAAVLIGFDANLRWPRSVFQYIVWFKVHESSEKTLSGK